MINCENLAIGYNSKSISAAFSLQIEENKWLGIIGENGIGKKQRVETKPTGALADAFAKLRSRE